MQKILQDILGSFLCTIIKIMVVLLNKVKRLYFHLWQMAIEDNKKSVEHKINAKGEFTNNKKLEIFLRDISIREVVSI